MRTRETDTSEQDARWISEISDEERARAMERYRLIAPLLRGGHRTREIITEACLAAGTSYRTLRRWLSVYRRSGLVGLVPDIRADRGSRRSCDAESEKRIRGWYLERQDRSAVKVWELATEHARRAGEKPPSYRTVARICAATPPAVVCLGKRGEKAYQDRYEPTTRYEVDRPNQRWHMDHTLVDVLLVRDEQKPGRPWLTTILDARSRAFMGYFLSFDRPTTLSNSLALRMAILPKKREDWPVCGIPDEVFVDNGKDLISRHMWAVSHDLKFELIPSQSGPRHNAKLERVFGTLSRGLLSELSGYTGPNVQRRPPKVRPHLTIEEFEEIFLEWILTKYHRAKNRTTGQTPLERFTLDFVPRLPESARHLDLLLVHEAMPRVIHRDGIQLFTQRYVAEEIASRIGEDAVVRYDPRDLSQVEVYVKDRWIATARAVDPDHPFTDVRTIKKLQRERRDEVEAELRICRSAVPRPMAFQAEDPQRPRPKKKAPSRKPKRVIHNFLVDKLKAEGRWKEDTAIWGSGGTAGTETRT